MAKHRIRNDKAKFRITLDFEDQDEALKFMIENPTSRLWEAGCPPKGRRKGGNPFRWKAFPFHLF